MINAKQLEGKSSRGVNRATSVAKELLSAEQVRRLLSLLGGLDAVVEPIKPPHPDVRVLAPSHRVAVETTEVH